MNTKAIACISASVAIAITMAMVAISYSIGSKLSSERSESIQTNAPSSGNSNAPKIQVVAAENFWGSLVSQLGGDRVQVLSIVSDPNADPHEYESNNADARAVSDANLVIVNGGGYDDWAVKLIAAGSHPSQKVLNVAELLGENQGDNPHFWYNPTYVNQTVKQMYSQLVSIDPGGSSYYSQQYASLNQSLGVYNTRISEIKAQFGGARIASTESIFEYLANASGLNLVSPLEFMQAVSEGTDPPVQSVAQFQQLLSDGNVTMLVYNEQTVTPLTQIVRSLAVEKGIPTVAVTETIQPAGLKFQDWMNAEVISMQDALSAKAPPQ